MKSAVSLPLLCSLFVFAGAMHFFSVDVFMRAMPPYLPYPQMLISLSGWLEILGGFALLVPIPKIREAAGSGLILLLIAVFPANIYMALNPPLFPEIPVWALYWRLPLQLVLIFWVNWVTIAAEKPKEES